MKRASGNIENWLSDPGTREFWWILATTSGLVALNSYMWREVGPYYPEWGGQAFMLPWIAFTLMSIRSGDYATAVTKAAIPWLVVMVPFFTGLLNGSTAGLFPHIGSGVYIVPPPVPMFGFEEYCIYAGLVCLIAVRFIPYRSQQP